MKKLFSGRYAALAAFVLYYLLFSFLVRLTLVMLSFGNIKDSLPSLLRVFGQGLIYDFTVSLAFCFFYSIYLLLMPSRWIGSKADRTATWLILFLMLFISLFAFAAEFPFWDEFKTRFNFIAVDYLIYTYEVVSNINQSYPIPLLLIGLLAVISIIFFVFWKKKIFHNAFQSQMRFGKRLGNTVLILALGTAGLFFLKNDQSEYSNNAYINELTKNGAFSFFNAYRTNELDYKKFYRTLPDKQAFSIIKKELLQDDDHYIRPVWDNITRTVNGENNSQRPNIVLICIESFSADFLTKFGNQDQLTPNYEKMAAQSIYFTNLYATGTRTVRGMEALTLSVPPTPGNSIVRRQDNEKLFSVATVLRKKDYQLSFIYGGDGYFDNMNAFFGGQGFAIVDRNRGNPLPEKIKTTRTSIEDKDVTFENAWGICDEDIYRQSLKRADTEAHSGKPFFQFVMTTSNHKPYSFPAGKINLPQGTRNAAVRYTDYALGKYMDAARAKPWFKNTVFVIIADHCASSAGKWEITPEKHHIPAILYNTGRQPQEVGKLVSQIDVMPTLFSLLGWTFDSAFYGKDIFRMKTNEERALMGNYRTLGLLKNNIFTQINDRREVKQFAFDPVKKQITTETKTADPTLQNLTVSYYQTASERFKNGKMKENKN